MSKTVEECASRMLEWFVSETSLFPLMPDRAHEILIQAAFQELDDFSLRCMHASLIWMSNPNHVIDPSHAHYEDAFETSKDLDALFDWSRSSEHRIELCNDELYNSHSTIFDLFQDAQRSEFRLVYERLYEELLEHAEFLENR